MKKLLVVAIVAGCTAKISGKLELDHQAFAPTDCRSGAVWAYSGVQLSDSHGLRLRLFQLTTGGVEAVVFAPGAAKGESLGDCGTIEIHTQASKIENIRNVEGKAVLSCSGGGHELTGTIEFENCH